MALLRLRRERACAYKHCPVAGMREARSVGREADNDAWYQLAPSPLVARRLFGEHDTVVQVRICLFIVFW